MLDLNQLAVFIRVVDEGSFTAAGKALNMPKSRVSRMVADLESNLGVRLLQRSTRQISLTQVGADYYDNCKHMVGDIMDVHTRISDQQDKPHGLLRIAVPMVVGAGIFGGFVARFQQMYPDVKVEVVHTDRQVNLIEEGFDLGMYMGQLPESSLVARTIGQTDTILCASPEYLALHGVPESPAKLSELDFVKVGDGMQAEVLEMVHENGDKTAVKVEPSIVTNNISVAINCIVSGAGVGQIPMFMAGDYIMSGRMQLLFPDWTVKPESISVVYPSRQYLSLKVRKFIDYLVAEIQGVRAEIDQLPTSEEQFVAFKKLLNM